MIAQFVSTLFDVDFYHRLFFFLSTPGGVLFRYVIELVFYTFLSYMVISEFNRAPRKELKYLAVAFVALMLQSVFGVVLYSAAVFGALRITLLNTFLPVLDHAVGMFTLVLLASAFLYPLFSARAETLSRLTRTLLVILAVVVIVIEISWLFTLQRHPEQSFLHFWGDLILVLIRVLLIVAVLFMITTYPAFKYQQKVYVGFACLLISPSLHLLNWLLFANDNQRLRLFAFPFPIIGLGFFTSVIYLKLVDKAYLKSQLEISQKRLRLEQDLGKMKDEFVSVVSHELRTPITAMKLYVALLLQDKFGRVSRRQKAALKTIKDENDRLALLITDILDISKLESRQITLTKGSFDVSALNNPLYFSMVKQKGLHMYYSIPKNMIVNVDAEKIKQVFVNLLSNAVKFTEKGGRIDVIVRDLGERWSLSVKDTGKGIPAAEIPKLFNKFYQVESHMTRQARGTGLGLAIVKKIVDLHGGAVDVHSQVGVGSTFTIILPK